MCRILASLAAAALLALAAGESAAASTDIHVRVATQPTEIPTLNPYCLWGQFSAPATANEGTVGVRMEECLALVQLEDNGGVSVLGNFTFAFPGGLVFTNDFYSTAPRWDGAILVVGGGSIDGGTGIYAHARGTVSISGSFLPSGVPNAFFRVVWSLHLE